MTRNEFMTALRSRLGALPREEQDAALKYYEEYFDEAASEEEAAQQLGSPDQIADRILSDYNAVPSAAEPVSSAQPEASPPPKQQHSALFWVGIVLLCIFASPFLLSLAAVLVGLAVGVAAAVLGVMAALVASFLAISVSLLGISLFMLFCALPAAIGVFTPGAVIIAGLSLCFGGLGVLSGIFTGYLCYWCYLFFKWIFTCGKRKKGAKIQ